MLACKKIVKKIMKRSTSTKPARAHPKRKASKKTLYDITLQELNEMISSKKVEEKSLLADDIINQLIFHLKEEQGTEKVEQKTEKKDTPKRDISDSFTQEEKNKKRVITDIDDVYSRQDDGSYEMQHHLSPAFYTSKIDYGELYSHMGVKRVQTTPGASYGSDWFKQSQQVVEHAMGAMTYEDGLSMTNRINVSTALQVYDNVSAEEKERYEHWKMFNKHMRRFYDAHSVVRGKRTGTSFKPMIKMHKGPM